MTDRRRRAQIIDPRQPASVSIYPRAAGFALLEVLIAGAVLAVGLTGAERSCVSRIRPAFSPIGIDIPPAPDTLVL